MNPVQDYINKARLAGQTDEQIIQSLIATGWQKEQILPFLASKEEKIQSNKKISLKLALPILLIVLISATFSAILGARVFTNKEDGKLAEEAKKAVLKNIKSSQKPLVAFTKDIDDSRSRVFIYDLSAKKFVDVDPVLNKEEDAHAILGPLSPDGRYLPIHYIRQSGLPHPLYFYDLKDNKAIKLFDTTEGQEFYSSSFLLFTEFWINNDSLASQKHRDLERKTADLILINKKGEINKITRPDDFIMGNDKIQANYGSLSEALFSGSNPKIIVKGKTIAQTVKGRLVGLIEDDFVTLEGPERPKLSDPQSLDYVDPALKAAMEEATRSAKTDEEAEKLWEEKGLEVLQNYFRPKGDWYLHFYSTADGSLKKTIIIKNDGWITMNAQIRPDKNTIIVQQQDNVISPSKARYLEINPNDGESKKTIFEGPYSSSIAQENFGLSSDGLWLIIAQPSGLKSMLGEDKVMFVAINFDTQETINLCEQNCRLLRIYNPESLRRM